MNIALHKKGIALVALLNSVMLFSALPAYSKGTLEGKQVKDMIFVHKQDSEIGISNYDPYITSSGIYIDPESVKISSDGVTVFKSYRGSNRIGLNPSYSWSSEAIVVNRCRRRAETMGVEAFRKIFYTEIGWDNDPTFCPTDLSAYKKRYRRRLGITWMSEEDHAYDCRTKEEIISDKKNKQWIKTQKSFQESKNLNIPIPTNYKRRRLLLWENATAREKEVYNIDTVQRKFDIVCKINSWPRISATASQIINGVSQDEAQAVNRAIKRDDSMCKLATDRDGCIRYNK